MIPEIGETEFEELSKTEELSGNLSHDEQYNKLMKSVIENDEKTVDDGKLISDAINQGFSSFTPDMMFDNLTKDFAMAENIMGEKMIRLISGYDPRYIKKNINVPEFKRELKEKIKEKIDDLKKEKLIKKDGSFSDKGIELASLILYTEELDNLIPAGMFGERFHKKVSIYGDREDVKEYKKGDIYRDLAIKSSIKVALRRGHKELSTQDLRTFERQSKGSVNIIYGIDASGSMKGDKIEAAKKAGIALSFTAIDNKDPVGLIVFGTEIKEKISPTLDFATLLRKITEIRASMETNMTQTIHESVNMFSKEGSKHLVLITDALPTIGKDPEKEVTEAVGTARAAGITISMIGIGLDDKGKKLAEKLVQLGEGRLYSIKKLENIDKIILEDYYSVV